MLYMFAITILSADMIAFALRRTHRAHLDEIDASFRASAPTPGARDDLPAAVVALAARLGARAGNRAKVAVFNQTGEMWQAPNTKPSVFSARQTAALDTPGFLWRASFQPTR